MKRKLTPNDINSIPLLIRTGLTNTEIANRLHISLSTLNYWIKRHRQSGNEIPTRKRGRPTYKITTPATPNP